MDGETGTKPDTRRKLSRPARRLQLIEATIEALAIHGYARMTSGDVARVAGLSHGLVNFHFDSKEKLLEATLDYLAEEYRQNWLAALEPVGPDPAQRIEALLRADFNPAICAPSRLAAWCSFWGEAQSRPMYQDHCGSNDEKYNSVLEALCARMNAEYGYAHDPVLAARVLRVTVEGVWLDLMTMRSAYSQAEALATVWACASAFYPRHFGPRGLLSGADPGGSAVDPGPGAARP